MKKRARGSTNARRNSAMLPMTPTVMMSETWYPRRMRS